MTELEKQNKEKRKKLPLTYNEWLGFFFLPFDWKFRTLFPTKDFNETELERFKKFGFDKKLKEAKKARLRGIIFYISIIILGIIILKN